MRVGWLVALALFVGCQENRSLEPPPVGSAESSLFLVAVDGAPTRAFAVAAGQPWPDVLLDEHVTLVVGTYAQTLGGLGLAPGEIDLGAQGAESPPAPLRELSLASPFVAWTESPEPSALWSTIKVPRATERCLEIDRVQLDELVVPDSITVGPCWANDIGFGGVWTGNDSGIWDARPEGFRQVLGGTVTSTLTPTGTSTAPILGAEEASPGRHLLYQAGGQVWRGDFGRGFEMVGRAPGAGLTRAAWTASGGRMRTQLYILDSDGGLWRWEEGGFRTILDPDPTRPIGREGGLAWLDTDDVLVLGPMGGQVLRVRDVAVEVLDPPGDPVMVLMASTQSGIVFADQDGQLYRYAGSMWRVLPAPKVPGTRWVSSLSGGLLYGPDSGAMQYWSESPADCVGEIQLEPGIFASFSLRRANYLFSSTAIFGERGPIVVTSLTTP